MWKSIQKGPPFSSLVFFLDNPLGIHLQVHTGVMLQERMSFMNQTVYEADVLCVGGGIAGLMAAIRAAESGARVIVAEKGNALASGAGRAGNDHFQCYIPEAHGADIKPFIQKLSSFRGQIRDKKV